MAEEYNAAPAPGDPNFVGPVALAPGSKPLNGGQPREDGKRVYSVPADYDGPMLTPNVIYVREAAPPPPPLAAGQGFKFDPDGAGEIIKQIDELLTGELAKAQREARRLTQIDPPGNEIASTAIASAANVSGESYKEFLESTIVQLRGFRDALIKVRDGKLQEEDFNRDTYNKGLKG